MGISDHITCLLRNLYEGQEATVRSRHGTKDWFRIEKGVHQAVYCHPAYLTYMQSTSYKMPDWMKHKLESRLSGEMSIMSGEMSDTLPVEPHVILVTLFNISQLYPFLSISNTDTLKRSHCYILFGTYNLPLF